MSPPGALLDECRSDEYDLSSRPIKKARLDQESEPANEDSSEATISWRHPLGVRPSGNAYLSTVNLKTSCGSFVALPDEIISQFLDYLDAATLLRLGATCKAMHAFTRSEELWKAFFTE